MHLVHKTHTQHTQWHTHTHTHFSKHNKTLPLEGNEIETPTVRQLTCTCICVYGELQGENERERETWGKHFWEGEDETDDFSQHLCAPNANKDTHYNKQTGTFFFSDIMLVQVPTHSTATLPHFLVQDKAKKSEAYSNTVHTCVHVTYLSLKVGSPFYNLVVLMTHPPNRS